MAARLPVVISQSARREPASTTCEEKLITELLFTPGLDATLIGPLEHVEAGSTDHLCLEGLKGPFALLGWTSLVDIQRQLSRLGVHGSIVDRDAGSGFSLPTDTSSQPDSSRRVDYFQLRVEGEPSVWVDALKMILEARDVKAFSIVLPSKSTLRAAVTGGASATHEVPVVAITKNDCSEIQPPVYAKTIDPNDEEEVWSHLDDLVDEMDRADV